MNKIDIDYDGEFGPELQLVIPYAYYLHRHNLLGKTVSSLDTACFYYFSREHEERYETRKYLPPEDPAKKNLPNKTEHASRLDTAKWLPPPYKKKFMNNRFIWKKEPLVISNKFNIEWDDRPFNYIALPVLKELITLLKDKYQIIYCRPTDEQIVPDHNKILSLGDFELIASFPEVLTIQQLERENSDLSFNTLQLMVFANCAKFISVQGGNSVLASYFGGTNIIYIAKGKELACGDYNYFGLFSGAKAYPCLNYAGLVSCIQKIFAP